MVVEGVGYQQDIGRSSRSRSGGSRWVGGSNVFLGGGGGCPCDRLVFVSSGGIWGMRCIAGSAAPGSWWVGVDVCPWGCDDFVGIPAGSLL